MNRLNVSHMHPDTVLQETLDRIDDEDLVEGALGPTCSVEASVKDRATRTKDPELSLELVAHAFDGVLALGEWTVDGQGGTAQELANRLAMERGRLQSGRILLLGCNTAMTVAGQNAITQLANVFGTSVAGTTVPLYARDFGADGIASNVLADDAHLPAPVDVSEQMVLKWVGRFEPRPELDLPSVRDRLRRETLGEATRDWHQTYPKYRWPVRMLADKTEFQSCFNRIKMPFTSAPGLLALPELELLAPVAGAGGEYYRLTVLLGGHIMRIYPENYPSGVLLRASSSLLRRLPTGAKIPALGPHQPRLRIR